MNELEAHVANLRLENERRTNETRTHLELALALTATMLLAGLWAGAPYQGRSFTLLLLSWTVGFAAAAIAYAVPTKRYGLLLYSPVFFIAAFGKELLAALFFCGALFGAPAAGLAAIFRPARSSWLLAGQAVLVAASSFCAIDAYFHFQERGARLAAQRGTQIVEAIHRYEESEGKLPETLGDLVPRQLESLPNTGMLGFPAFRYYGPVDSAVADEEGRLFSTYELRVNLYKLMKFDSLIYWPGEHYPDSMYGGGVERIGDWAYVHE